ncbi:hypothetical protein J5N97_003538 [Dioscorea zingiberensis]|uniref:Uncharacterized protein n=1 Tax=Dioscorea zingiberensis TaxID=325984 RepID=A0A9D5D6C0_9LILI|nr:hypothetical protein J5N97_003538 [Dioscorea zingiberensis]
MHWNDQMVYQSLKESITCPSPSFLMTSGGRASNRRNGGWNVGRVGEEMEVDPIHLQEVVSGDSGFRNRMSSCKEDELSEGNECNVSCDSLFTSDSSDSEFHESDYDMEDDDDKGPSIGEGSSIQTHGVNANRMFGGSSQFITHAGSGRVQVDAGSGRVFVDARQEGSSQVVNTQQSCVTGARYANPHTHQQRQRGRQVPSRYMRDLPQAGSMAQRKRKVSSNIALQVNKKELSKSIHVEKDC